MRKPLAILAAVLILVFLLITVREDSAFQRKTPDIPTVTTSGSVKVDRDFGKIPLYFIRNEGQVDAQIGFYLQGRDKTIYFGSEGLTFELNGRRVRDREEGEADLRRNRSSPDMVKNEPQNLGRWVVKLDFLGANSDMQPSGVDKTEAVISYFKGKPEEWKIGLPTYSRIIYKNLWPGIDLAYHGTYDRLKYEFIVHSGADPSAIRLAYRGASAVEVNGEGRLEVRTPVGDFKDDIPIGYQEVDGEKVEVALRYALELEETGGPTVSVKHDSTLESPSSETYVYGFDVGDYDRTKPLILDPAVLVYCGYIGGSNRDFAGGIAIDTAGNAYVMGDTLSSQPSFPVTSGPDLTYNGDEDAFVAKVNPTGTTLLYCGYIGGSSDEFGGGIAVDGAGNAYVTGYTDSSQATFPVKVGPDLTYNGSRDAFVAKVNATGTELVYCGYIGGSTSDYGQDVAINAAGNAYVAGYTVSSQATFPVTSGPDLTHNGGNDAFVAKLNATGTELDYCGYIGGSSDDFGNGIAINAAGNAHVVGYTESTQATFPVTSGPDLTHNDGSDAFVAKLNSTGTTLLYCGYIGGSEDDYGNGIAVDGVGHAYITGSTFSTQANFPVYGGPDLTHNDGSDAFVAKLNSTGTTLLLCGYIGGSLDDHGHGIALDAAKNAYIMGTTLSSQATFPVTSGPDLTHNGSNDAFVAKVKSTGKILNFCGYIGGLNNDNGCCIAIDAVGNAYVAGRTGSPQATFPVSSGPDLTHNGGWDVFVAKISSLRIEDLLGTWDGQGVYYKDSETGLWHCLESSPASQIAAGDLDGDGTDDLIGTWAAQPGVWVKKSSTGTWVKLDSVTPTWIAGGEMGAAGGDGFKAGLRRASGLFQTKGSYDDLSGYGPHGRDFRRRIEENAWVGCKIDGERQRRMTPGPREPGFRPVREKNRSGGKEKK